MIDLKELGDLVYNHLLDDGWHIGDGVDDCAGTDGDRMDKSCADLLLKIRTFVQAKEVKL